MDLEGNWAVRLAICTATMQPQKDATLPTTDLVSWSGLAFEQITTAIRYNTTEDNLGVVGSYEWLYRGTHQEVLLFLHDDVACREQDWDARVLAAFEDPEVGVCGFGGAKRHGDPSLYKVPYKLQHLGRSGYLSNVDDAEVHGTRFTGETDVAVLDGFALAIRRELLDKSNMWGFIKPHADFFCYDYAVSAISRRYGYRTRLIGLRCHHRGGQTSVLNDVKDITSQEAYDKAHAWYYSEFRDVMPYEVP
jgi:hypothetical protein